MKAELKSVCNMLDNGLTQALVMQLCLEPGFLAEALRREDIADLPSAVELLLSEIMLLGGLALAHYKQQAP